MEGGPFGPFVAGDGGNVPLGTKTWSAWSGTCYLPAELTISAIEPAEVAEAQQVSGMVAVRAAERTKAPTSMPQPAAAAAEAGRPPGTSTAKPVPPAPPEPSAGLP